MTDYIKLSQAAPLLKHHLNTIQRWAMRGQLKAVKIGQKWFTTREWVDEFIAQSNKSRPHVAARILKERQPRIDQALRALGFKLSERE